MPRDIGPQLIAMLPRLRRYALKLARGAEVADDLVQSACERALATAAQPGNAPFDAWMFRILRNLQFDRLRQLQAQGVSVDIEMQDEVAAADASGAQEARQALDRVHAAIDRLPAGQREVLLLVCVEELSYCDAAAVLDVPVGTVMSRLARARLKLAELTGLTAESQ